MNKSPKPRTNPSKRCRFKNLFQNNRGDWCIDLSQGGRRIIRVIGKSRLRAEDVLAAPKTDLNRGLDVLRKPGLIMTFQEFAAEFLNVHAIQKKSYRRDKGALDHHLIPFFGFFKLSDIKTQAIEKYKNKRSEEYDGRQKEDAEERRVISGATINREVALLKTILNKAVEWEKIEDSPLKWKRVKKFAENGRERYLSKTEKAKLFIEASSSSPYLKNFLILAINTGLRKGEILGLRWRDVELASGEIVLERVRRKNKRALRMPLNRVVLEVLTSMPRYSEYVFYNPDTKGPVKDVRTAFETACRAAKIKNLRIHDLRRTFATTLSGKGFDIATISSLLGHSSITMTQSYITPISERMRKAVDVMADAFDEEKPSNSTESRKKAERSPETVSEESQKAEYIQ